MYPDKFITSINDVPNEEHYIVLEGKSIYVPGDERSRTNPGHGYPAETVHTLSYNLVSESRLQKYIESLIEQKKVPNVDFKVIKVTPVEVKTKVEIEVNTIVSDPIAQAIKEWECAGLETLCSKESFIAWRLSRTKPL